MELLKIKPNDTLFFRDGKPFDAGENMWLGTCFMPNPSVFYGAIFSAILSQNSEYREEILNKEPEEILKINRVYIYDRKDNEFYMPCPRDLFKNDNGRVRFGEIREDGLLYYPSDSFSDVDNDYIGVLNFVSSYAKNNVASISLINGDEIFTNSYKVGIKKDFKKRTAKDEHLYRIDVVEFADLGLDYNNGYDWNYVVEYEINKDKIKLNEKGLLKLGGEGKSCKYEKIGDMPYDLEDLKKYYKDEICRSNKVKMILTSPGIYEREGWKPKFCGDDIKLYAAITGKPLYLGGFDMKRNKPKPMYRAVPRGSVYILESESFKDKNFGKIQHIIRENIVDDIDSFRGFNSFEIVSYGR